VNKGFGVEPCPFFFIHMKIFSKIKQLKDLTQKIDEIEQRRSLKNNNKFILDYNVDGLLVADKNLSIEFCNPALLELIDYKSEDLIGKNITRLMEDSNKKRHLIENIRNKIIENRQKNNICQLESYKICEDAYGIIVDSRGNKINVLISVGEIITDGIQQFICIIRKINRDEQ
jgi:PAS domain S-box-containing protein